MHEERFKDMDVIFCGHSLGGAVASIASIRLKVEKARYKLKGSVKCITFGAPLFGDEQLRKSINCRNMHHFVSNNDPIPNLLSYAQSISSFVLGLDAQIAALTHHFSTAEGASYHQQNTENLLHEKLEYLKIFSELAPIFSSVIEAAAVFYPGVTLINEIKKMISIVNDMKSSTTTKQNVYVPIGNFYFLDDKSHSNKVFQCSDFHGIQQHTENHFKSHSEDIRSDVHALSNYTNLLRTSSQPKIPFGKYIDYVDSATHIEFFIPSFRDVRFSQPFAPVIHSVELVKVENRGTSILRLSFTGVHLLEIVLEQCQFHFNFPFASNKDNTTVKKVFMGENIQRLVLEDTCQENIAISDHGINLIFVTQFGKCEKILRREDMRNLVIQNVKQIANHDSVSLVVRRAIQRGLALTKIRMDAGCGSSDRMMQEIKELGDIALGSEAMKKVRTMFDDSVKDFHFILSNEEAFGKVKEFCEKIENYLRSPMKIQAKWSVLQKIVFGLTVTVGTAAVGYLAGPALVMIGIVNSISGTAVVSGGLLGGLTAGASANALMQETFTDSAYENALKWINQQLLEAKKKYLDGEQLKIIDLQDDGTIYSQEKILMLLTDGDNKTFPDTDALSRCTQTTKDIVCNRIKVVKKIHNIRAIFSQQCFIGLVGLQDAGKTTLLRKIWGVGGKTGLFIHTDAPLLYEVTPKLLVVDFPGSNSLDYHAKTFSICGAINNMVIVVIPFSGDISKVISDEVQNVFSVMRGSDSTKVILCINKCGLYLKRLKEELKAEEAPVEYLKNRFVNKLNEHCEDTGTGIAIKHEDILFTDWEIEDGDKDEAKKFGIVGVEVVKDRIMEYLVNYGIYKEEGEDELRKCISTLRV